MPRDPSLHIMYEESLQTWNVDILIKIGKYMLQSQEWKPYFSGLLVSLMAV